MIVWPKLLAMAHAVSSSVEPFLALYLWHTPALSQLVIAMLIALASMVRLAASGVCIWIVDRSPPAVHLRVLLGLTLAGTAALLGVLSLAAFDGRWLVMLAACFMMGNGLFFQPLAALVDSAIIKSLGDYKIWLYDDERQWGKAASAISLVAIGCASNSLFANDAHPLLLACTLLTGSLALCVVLLLMQRRGLGQLECIDEPGDEEESPAMAPRFLKNAILFPHRDIPYKPYSLFGEPLSHISEEDASMLQRIASSNTTTAQLMRHGSNHSANSTTTTASAAALAASGSVPVTMYGSTNTTMTSATSHAFDLFSFWRRRNTLAHQHHQQHLQPSLPPHTHTSAADLCSSAELSLLPLPPHDTPMAVLLLLQNMPSQLVASPTDAMIEWQIQSMSITTLILGVVYGMINPLLLIYLRDVLDLSMWLVGVAAMMPVLADMAVHASARWWIPRFTATAAATTVHAILIVCAFSYTWLRAEWPALWLVVCTLQVLQGSAFHLIWLAIVHRVSALLWSEEEQFRIAQVGKLSALYSSIGPAIGVFLAGFLLSNDSSDVGSSGVAATASGLLEGFTLIYRCAIALTAASFVVSWGWSSTN